MEGSGNSDDRGDAAEGIWRGVLEAMPGPVCVVDREERVLFVNTALVALIGGGGFQEFLSRPAADVLDPLPFEVQRALHSALRLGTKVNVRIPWEERKEGPVILESTAFPIPLHGAVTPPAAAWTAMVFPAAQPGREALARDASRRKGKDLLSVVRHDILNQLTILIGFLQFSEDFIQDPPVREFLAKEEAAGQVIQALIEFTRDFQDLFIEDPRWMPLGDVIGSAKGRVDPTGVAIGLKVGNVEVFASPLISHVFFTLIKNALDHAKGLTRITISVERQGDDLLVVCEDDGPGVHPTEKKTLFDRGHGRNRGYSLWLAGEILSITGASIREAGSEGTGARFEIRIPAGMWRGA